MVRPRAADAATTTDRLLAAAEVEFARRGFAAARLADVAAAAGIRRPSLLYHFPSKQALYEAVVSRVFERLGEALAAAMTAEGEFQDRFEGVVEAFTGFVRANPPFATLILRELLDDQGQGRDLLRARLVPLLDWVESFVAEEGQGCLPPGIPVRSLVLQIASGVLLNAAAGSLRAPLWREEDDPVALLRVTLFRSTLAETS